MKLIEIEWLSDSSDCETCGSSWASGASVKFDGVPFGDFEPFAACYDGDSFSPEDVLLAIVKHLCPSVEIEWLSDSTDCDQPGCGGGWAEGADVKIDGVPFGDFIPKATCYECTSYEQESILIAILNHLGYEVRIK